MFNTCFHFAHRVNVTLSLALTLLALIGSTFVKPTYAQVTPSVSVNLQCPPALNSEFWPAHFSLTITPSGFPEDTFVNYFLFTPDAQEFHLGGGGSPTIGGFVGDTFDFSSFTLSPGSYTVTANHQNPFEDPRATFVIAHCVLPIEVDVKPGNANNTIAPKAKGKVPVAVLSSANFDARNLDPRTIRMNSSLPNVRLKLNGSSQVSLQDVNSDGLQDLLVHIEIQTLQLSGETDVSVVLVGDTFGGARVRGTDVVRIVP
jgi:hypothetical protein